jgi:hypothetical protein
MPKISETEYIQVELDSPVRLLETATKRAIPIALDRFGIDECGHSDKVKDWQRKNCSIRMDFTGIQMHGGMMGWTHVVNFTAWCEKCED